MESERDKSAAPVVLCVERVGIQLLYEVWTSVIKKLLHLFSGYYFVCALLPFFDLYLIHTLRECVCVNVFSCAFDPVLLVEACFALSIQFANIIWSSVFYGNGNVFCTVLIRRCLVPSSMRLSVRATNGSFCLIKPPAIAAVPTNFGVATRWNRNESALGE